MSLKAKMEAVIYASEEPVTLAQLVSLLGEEAQAEIDREQHELDLQAAEAAATEPGDGESASVADEEGVPAQEADIPAPAEDAAVAAAPETEAPTEAAAEEETVEVEGTGKKKKLTEAEKAAARRLREFFRKQLEELMKEYADGPRGIEIREVAGGYRFATKPEFHDAVRGFVKSLKPPLKLSLPALETLAVIAYKQPVTAPEISEVRGVDSGGVLGSLVARKLITTAGRKQVIGRPILYKTTKDFLLKFGLKDIAELPSIEEFEKMAGELAEQEEIPMGDHSSGGHDDAQVSDHSHMEQENAVEPQADGDSTDADEVEDAGEESSEEAAEEQTEQESDEQAAEPQAEEESGQEESEQQTDQPTESQEVESQDEEAPAESQEESEAEAAEETQSEDAKAEE